MAMRKISSFTEDHFQRSHLELHILKGGRTDSQVMDGEAFSDTKSLLRKQVYQSLKITLYQLQSYILYFPKLYQFSISCGHKYTSICPPISSNFEVKKDSHLHYRLTHK